MGLKVLLTEDDESIQLIVRLGLVDLGGMDVSIANNGQEALDKLGNEHPDLIISDLFMPVMDGPQLLKELKSREATSEVPIIFLSADNCPVKKKELINAGAIDVIHKPFDPMSLASVINEIFKRFQAEN